MLPRAFLFAALAWSSFSQADSYSISYYYLPSALYQALPESYGGTVSAGAIIDSGQIVGSYDYGSGGSGQSGLFFYANGSISVSPYPSTDYIQSAGGASNGGSVVGSYRTDNAIAPYHGFVYSNGVYTTLDDPTVNPGATWPSGTQLRGVNDSGAIVGNSFVYENGVFTNIDDPSAQYTNPASINNQGQIVGTTVRPGCGHAVYSGFIYQDGVFTRLDYPGARGYGTFVTGNNDLGQVVGYFEDASYVAHSFLYANGVYTLLPLPNYVNASDSSFPETLNNWVYDINNNGQILGAVQMPDGYSNVTYTVVLTPVPEPQVSASLLSGLILVGAAARRRTRSG